MPSLQNGMKGKGARVVPFSSAHTANTTITRRDNGALFTNAGASGNVTLTLPPALAGTRFEFMSVVATHDLIVVRAGSDVIGTGAGTTLTLANLGDSAELHCAVDGRWLVRNSAGTAAIS